MKKEKVLVKGLVLLVCLFMLSVPSVMAQLPCTADFDCDQDVDAEDVTEFLNQFGRNQYNDPCPDCYDSPCPCPEECPASYCEVGVGDCNQGVQDCCCCLPEFLLGMGVPGVCRPFEECLYQEPDPQWGFYMCW